MFKNENAFSILSVHFDPNTSTVITNAASANIYPSVSSNSAAAEVQLAQNDRPNHVHHNVILKTREGAEQKRRQSIVAAIIEEPAEVSDRSLLAKKRASLTQTSEEKTALIDNTSKPATVTTIKQGGVNGHLKTAALEDVRPSINKPSNDDRSNDQQKQTECIAQSITSKQTTNKKVEAKSVQQKAAEGKKPDATKITTSEETQGAKKVEAKKQISLGEVQAPTRHSQAPQESTEFTALGYKVVALKVHSLII